MGAVLKELRRLRVAPTLFVGRAKSGQFDGWRVCWLGGRVFADRERDFLYVAAGFLVLVRFF